MIFKLIFKKTSIIALCILSAGALLSLKGHKDPELIQDDSFASIVHKVSDILSKSTQLQKTTLYQTLVFGELSTRCLYDLCTLGPYGAMSTVAQAAIQNPYVYTSLDACISPWIHKDYRKNLSAFLSLCSQSLSTYTAFYHGIPLCSRTLFGLAGLYITQKILPYCTQDTVTQRNLAAIALFGLHKLGWRAGVASLQTQVAQLLNALPDKIFQGLSGLPILGAQGAPTPSNLDPETCPAWDIHDPFKEQCPAFSDQKELNQVVGQIGQHMYANINNQQLWTYPDSNEGYSTQSECWEVIPSSCPGTPCCNQAFKPKDSCLYRTALQDLFNSETKLDCLRAQKFVIQYIYLKLLGEEHFARIVERLSRTALKDGIIVCGPKESIPFSFLEVPDMDKPFGEAPRAGTFTYLFNHPLYVKISPNGFMQGYNLITVEEDAFIGFGPEFKAPKNYTAIVDMYHKDILNSLDESSMQMNPEDIQTLQDPEVFRLVVDLNNEISWLAYSSSHQISFEQLQKLLENPEKALQEGLPLHRESVLQDFYLKRIFDETETETNGNEEI